MAGQPDLLKRYGLFEETKQFPLGGFMRIKAVSGLVLWMLILASSPLLGQNFYLHKDLAFGQIAAGGGYETVINVTNRGTRVYNGTLHLYSTANGQAWSPLTINGIVVTGGNLVVAIPAGATRSYHISLSDNVQVGFGYFYSDDIVQDNFLEGNLTYFIRSGSTLIGSVGVPGSQEFYVAAIPFEDFSTVALALANGSISSSEVAHVTLTLFNETGGNPLASTQLTMGASVHTAKFLYQLFPGVSLGRGRLEIVTSDFPILGTALTFVGTQASSLPLVGSPRSYTFTTSGSDGSTTSGDASLWADGYYVRGYIRFTTRNGASLADPEQYWLAGRFISGSDSGLRLSFFFGSGSKALGTTSGNFYARVKPFDFSTSRFSDIFVVTWVDPGGSNPYGSSVAGTMTWTRTN
jgi:hypothetical protein